MGLLATYFWRITLNPCQHLPSGRENPWITLCQPQWTWDVVSIDQHDPLRLVCSVHQQVFKLVDYPFAFDFRIPHIWLVGGLEHEFYFSIY